MRTILSFTLVLCLSIINQLNAQFVKEYMENGNSANIAAKITLDGNALPPGSQVAAYEVGSGNQVGMGTVINFGFDSYLNFAIYGTVPERNQLSSSECFTLKIYHDILNEYFDVEVVNDPRACGTSSSLTAQGGMTINLSASNRNSTTPTEFGPYTNKNGGPLSPDWDGNLDLLSLPVEFKEFNLKNNECNDVHFSWSTLTELNNKGFEVQRKTNIDRGWNTIGYVNGNGDSNEEIKYSFQDIEVTKIFEVEYAYYRLKQVDYNGEYAFSTVMGVRLNCNDESYINVYPNPAKEEITISLGAKDLDQEEVEFQIFNLTGQLITKFTRTMSDNDRIQHYLSGYEPGVYRIQTISKGRLLSNTKFIKS